MSVRPSTPPGGAGGTVFKGDAGLGQLLADGVGLGEVPSLAGSQSGVDQCLDRIIVEIALMSCCAAQSVAAHCDRILVMGEGELRGELRPDDFEEEKLLTLSMTPPQPKTAEAQA